MKLENLERIMKLGRKREEVLNDIKNLKEKLVKLKECDNVKFVEELCLYEVICGNDDKENIVGIKSFDFNNDNFKKDLSKFIIDYINNGINNNIKELENKVVEIENELKAKLFEETVENKEGVMRYSFDFDKKAISCVI